MFSVYFDAGTESQPVANETKGEQQIKKDKKGMGVLTEICQRESSHGQQYEIKHIEQAVLHNLVGTYAATVQDDASRNGAGKIAQTEKNQNLRQCSVKYFLF
ncbi:hypothetical protein I090019C5_32530 [Phocaeicola massiliensis]